jgi:hypothetical protein
MLLPNNTTSPSRTVHATTGRPWARSARVRSFQAASYNYPSGQMVIGAALAGVMQRTGLSLSALRMLAPEARRRLSPLDRQYIPSLMVAQRLEMGQAYMQAIAQAEGLISSQGASSLMLGALGAKCDPTKQSCPPSGGSSRAKLDKAAADAQKELEAAASDPNAGGKVKAAVQKRAAAKVTADAAKKAPPESSTFGQFAAAVADPLSAFMASLGQEIGRAAAKFWFDLMREVIDWVKCEAQGFDYCNPDGAKNAVVAELAASWGGGSAAAIAYFFAPQDKGLIDKFNVCDNDHDGGKDIGCRAWSDKAFASSDFVRNKGALVARTKECRDNKVLRDRLGLLTDEDRAAIQRFAMFQAALTWVSAQTDPLMLDIDVIQEDPNFQGLSATQKATVGKKVAEKKAQLEKGITPPSEEAGAAMGMGTVALVVGALAVAGGAYYFFKMQKPA